MARDVGRVRAISNRYDIEDEKEELPRFLYEAPPTQLCGVWDRSRHRDSTSRCVSVGSATCRCQPATVGAEGQVRYIFYIFTVQAQGRH